MDRRIKIYWVEVLEKKVAKKVPHTGKKNCEFVSRADANTFKDELKLNNHGKRFRLVKATTIISSEKWEGIGVKELQP